MPDPVSPFPTQYSQLNLPCMGIMALKECRSGMSAMTTLSVMSVSSLISRTIGLETPKKHRRIIFVFVPFLCFGTRTNS